MDEPSALDPADFTGKPSMRTDGAAAPESEHPRDRRHERPQLSCLSCRRRKVRCDRQLPCNTCVSKGVALSCSYPSGAQRKSAASVGDRIQQLEALVRSLVQQQRASTPQTPAVPPGGPCKESPASADQGSLHTSASPLPAGDRSASVAPSDPGSLRVHPNGANYVGSVHWAAVLDSISELKDHYQKEEEARVLANNSRYVPYFTPGPRLFYEPVQATKADILASIPARAAVDRMVARYFNAQDVGPALWLTILHSGQFLREYESFWQDPTATPFTWLGLLFSIMCASTQNQQLKQDLTDADTLTRVYLFRERAVHCLILGQFTKGGPHVIETMMHLLRSELLLCEDANIGLWLLAGNIVQLALSLGYHRDPRNFPNISPFDGEMRRRIWACVLQLDLRLSSQVGLPRLLKSQLSESDTDRPRNLLDSDFDEATVELPPSRPETEVTPVLYLLARDRIDSIGGLISDLVADTRDRQHPYTEIMDLDRRIREAEDLLPPVFRWQPLGQSFMVQPLIVLYRIWAQLTLHRLVIWLHRKYLPPSDALEDHEYSRNACVHAAIKILEFQQMVDEETQPDGLLYSVRWVSSSMLQSAFLLGMSILCYYLQLAKITPSVPLDQATRAKIYELLRKTYPIWLRSSTVSRDALEAVEHLSLLLGLRNQQEEGGKPHNLAVPQEGGGATEFDQITWDVYQECIANLPAASSTADFMAMDTPISSSAASAAIPDPL